MVEEEVFLLYLLPTAEVDEEERDPLEELVNLVRYDHVSLALLGHVDAELVVPGRVQVFGETLILGLVHVGGWSGASRHVKY